MKISHKELEACRISPKNWVVARQSAGGARRFSYKQALSLAISELHRTDSVGAANKKIDKYVASNFKDERKIAKLYEILDNYAKWFGESGIISADANVLLAYPSNSQWQLGGIVSRVDLLPFGYRAVLFEPIISAWKGQLRMPLIQMAVANRYGRPASEVRVGLQDIDGNAVVDARYTKSEQSQALTEFEGIGVKVAKLLPASFQ